MNSERLKVLFITHSFPQVAVGPQSDSLRLLADALADQGVDVRVVAPDVHGDLPGTEDARVERFSVASPRVRSGEATSAENAESDAGARRSAGARVARRTALNYLGAGFGSAVKARRDFEPDLVHAHWWFPSGLVGSWLSSLASVPLITSLHGFDPQIGREGSPARPLFRHVLRRSAAITVESNSEARRLATVLDGVAPVIIPLPLATDIFRPGDDRKSVAVLIGGGDSDSDSALRAAAMRSLAEGGTDIALVAANGEEDSLRKLIAHTGVGGKATVVAASDHAALAGILGKARVCAVFGNVDAQRASVSAAMLSGVPLALFDASEREDLLTHHANIATEIGAGTPEARIDQLQSILADESTLRQQGEAARMYALATLAPESCAARLLGVYLRALGDAAA